jgi:hypothetical protein
MEPAAFLPPLQVFLKKRLTTRAQRGYIKPMSMITTQPPVSRTKFSMTLNLSLFQFLRIAAIAAIIVFSFVSCGILDLSGKEEKKEQTEEPKKEQPGGEEPGGNQPGNQPGGNQPGGEEPGGNQPGGNNPGGEQPGGNPGGETPGEGEEPGGQQEVARQQGPQTIDISKGDYTGNTIVTGFMTDSQWAAAVPKLKNVIVGPSVQDVMLNMIFFGNPPPIDQIVLETSSVGYGRYKVDLNGKKIFINTNHIDANTFGDVINYFLGGAGDHAKVDARDTVRMAKAPVNGKAFATGIFAQLPQSRAAISQGCAECLSPKTSGVPLHLTTLYIVVAQAYPCLFFKHLPLAARSA